MNKDILMCAFKFQGFYVRFYRANDYFKVCIQNLRTLHEMLTAIIPSNTVIDGLQKESVEIMVRKDKAK